MKTKHITAMTLAMVTAIMVLSGCAPRPEEPEVQEETAAPAAEETARVFTDADFIEYQAQMAYLTEKYAKDPIKGGEEVGKLLEKYAGIDEKLMTWMTEWQQKAMTDPEKAGKQWEEMMKSVESRTNELKGK